VPRLLQVARDRGWWDPVADPDREAAATAGTASGAPEPTIVGAIDAASWGRVTLASRVIPPADPSADHALILAAIRDGATVSAALDGNVVVGLAIAGAPDERGERELLAVGVAPDYRQRGLARALLTALAQDGDATLGLHAQITVAERDPIEPLERGVRASIARRLLQGAGFEITAADVDLRGADPASFRAVRSAPG
jgi:ribosomal protein S18 acetylase RimI-like enzyme